MRSLTNDPVAVAAAAGFDSWRYSLPPKLGIDQFRSVLPVLVFGEDEQPVLIAKEIDRANMQAISKPGVRFLFHTPYFSFDALEQPSDARPYLEAAVAEVAGADTDLDPDLPVALHDRLADSLGCGLSRDGAFLAPAYHYVLPRMTPSAQAEQGRDEALDAARPFVRQTDSPDRLLDWLHHPAGDILHALDSMMAAAGLDALVASSPINVQELSGVPAAQLGARVWALYPRDAAEVHLLSRRELPWTGLPDPRPAGCDVIAHLVGAGTVGYEELDLTHRAFRGFGLDALPTRPASQVLRRWRETRCWEDLAYYIIGSQITRAGIDAALQVVADGMRGGEWASELDAYARYREVIAREVAPLPIRVRTYFTHTHAGDRSHIPSSATAHQVDRTTSLKIDAGLEIYDERGFLRAVSDVTRTAVGTPAAHEFVAVLDDALCNAAIAGCRPGTTGQEIFRRSLDHLEPQRGWLEDEGFCPRSDRRLTEIFGRDIGHLLGKQEPATCVFDSACTGTLEAGMVAAAEIQWPYRRYCVGVEDNFLITDDGPINFTRATS